MNLDDTIVAIATPAGRGGIGVIRLAGPAARAIAGPMLRIKHPLEPGRAVFGELVDVTAEGNTADHNGSDAAYEAAEKFVNGVKTPPAGAEAQSNLNDLAARLKSCPPVPAQFASVSAACYGAATDPHGQRIDEVVVTFFEKPHSYTTDDIIEISCHGSPVVLRRVVELCLGGGARLAEPGEFTMRAFLNGRLDLTQAEAVRDLIDSRTLFQAKVAAQQLGGALSKRLKPVKSVLADLIALLEAGIDFAEDDISIAPDATILEQIAQVRAPLEQLSASFAFGKLVHEGLTLAIVGRPNVGKSSLFNRLVERDRAIVTAQPGTTRDLVSETVAIGGIPVRLVDTAGIRQALDEAESIGIQKSMEALADADLVLVVLDSTQPVTDEDFELLRLVEGRAAIVVENKSDQNSSRLPRMESQLARVTTSALTGDGVSELRAAILRQAGGESGAHIENGFLTNVRHQKLVNDSLIALDAARDAVGARVPHEMMLLDLYGSLRSLDEITGATTADDILNLIFGSFCIGK